MLRMGKTPSKNEGYATETARGTSYKTDAYYRWRWSEYDGYTLTVEPETGTEFIDSKVFADDPPGESHLDGIQKSLKRYFRFRANRVGDTDTFDPDRTFDSNSSNQPQDYLTRTERGLIREASLKHGSLPDYHSITPERREGLKVYLSQRLEKPAAEVTPDDFDRANGRKVPSLVMASLDLGLRPIEVGRARTSWVDTQNCLFRIPKQDSGSDRRRPRPLARETGEQPQLRRARHPVADRARNPVRVRFPGVPAPTAL